MFHSGILGHEVPFTRNHAGATSNLTAFKVNGQQYLEVCDPRDDRFEWMMLPDVNNRIGHVRYPGRVHDGDGARLCVAAPRAGYIPRRMALPYVRQTQHLHENHGCASPW